MTVFKITPKNPYSPMVWILANNQDEAVELWSMSYYGTRTIEDILKIEEIVEKGIFVQDEQRYGSYY